MKNIVRFISSMLILTCLLCSCDLPEKRKMTPEEYAAYRQSFVAEYELCSVSQYVKQDTNMFGGVIRTDICYAFTYIDHDGNLKSVDDFEHLEYGLTKVCIGDTDKYVVDSWGEQIRYLYLTKETLQSIKIENS